MVLDVDHWMFILSMDGVHPSYMIIINSHLALNNNHPSIYYGSGYFVGTGKNRKYAILPSPIKISCTIHKRHIIIL